MNHPGMRHFTRSPETIWDHELANPGSRSPVTAAWNEAAIGQTRREGKPVRYKSEPARGTPRFSAGPWTFANLARLRRWWRRSTPMARHRSCLTVTLRMRRTPSPRWSGPMGGPQKRCRWFFAAVRLAGGDPWQAALSACCTKECLTVPASEIRPARRSIRCEVADRIANSFIRRAEMGEVALVDGRDRQDDQNVEGIERGIDDRAIADVAT